MWNDWIKAFTDLGVSEGVATVYLLVCVLLVIMLVVAVIMRIVVVVKYSVGNKTRTKSGKTSFQVAREALDRAGLKHIQVKRAGLLRTFFFGNSYSISQKTVFLRRRISDKDSITAVGMALQKVGIAQMCEKGGLTKARNVMQVLSLFGPILFLPVVLIGFLLDALLFEALGAFSVAGIVIGLFLVLSGFFATILNLPVEKKANKIAMQLIRETGVLNEEEQRIIKKVFDAYIVAYVCEFIVALLRIVQLVLEIVINIQANNSESK